MKIKQILNNNAVLVSKGSNECVVLANGIGFKKKIGQRIDESEINKIFVLQTHEMVEHFSYQLSKSEPNRLLMIEKIVAFAKEKYGIEVSDYIYLTLLDHLDYTLKRIKEGIEFNSPLQWEIKRFYKNEVEVGKYALDVVKEMTGVKLPEEEAISIALHFINVQSNKKDMFETTRIAKFIDDVIKIVKYELNMQFEEESFNFSRFVTHLHYFAQRIMEHDIVEKGENALYLQVKNLYPIAYKCVQRIKLYVYNTYQILISENEEVYLIIHIQKVSERN